MIAVLSPAKSFALLDTAPVTPTSPHFAVDAARLARSAARLKTARLRELMHISPALAAKNADRFAHFDELEPRPAIASFDGDVYRGFDAATADAATLDWAQGHVRILSGLYGLLRPSDLIRPYRLEMGTRWAPRGDDLYGFWKRRLGARLEAELAADGSSLVLNLASKEYWRALGPALSKRTRVVAADFRELGPRGLRFNTFSAKKARGAMARFMCERRAAAMEDLRAFAYDGYAFDADASDEAKLMFIRR